MENTNMPLFLWWNEPGNQAEKKGVLFR